MKHLKAILAAVFLATAGGAAAAPVNSGHVLLDLVPSASQVAPGGTVYVALHQKIAKGWHTYWRNPGDAGDPPKLGWTLPSGWRSGDIVWPAPRRLPVGPLMDYGYEGEVYLPVAITAPANAPATRPATLKAAVSLLVCKDVCVPEDATLSLDLDVSRAAGGSSSAAVQAALSAAPRAGVLTTAWALKGGKLQLAATGSALKAGPRSDAYFYPYSSTVIAHPKPQLIDRGPQGLTLAIEPGYAFTKGPRPVTLDGALVVDGRAFEVSARQGPLPAGAAGLGPPPAAAQGAGGGLNLALAAGFAFLGGVILNLMPCVFPILSMKAIGLASHSGAGARPRLQGLAFLAGVLATFVGLAAALIAAKAAGSEVGWGFQLQSPAVVTVLCLVMLLIGLNLSGVFEAGLSLQTAAGGAGHGGGVVGSALTGALAVVVAAPCTAPFMASAIAYAFTQPEWAALTVFVALGLGFAFPFTLVSFVPGLLRRMPRPGPWMDGLKQVLAFPMYGAAAWLLWVLTLQAGSGALAAVLASGVVLGLAAYVYGAAQRRQIAGGRAVLLYAVSTIALIGAAGLAFAGLRAPSSAAAATPGASAAALPEEPYSAARLAELRAQGKPVFVDFTAAWCITCQVNKQVALSSPEVAKAFARAGAVYLEADWTRRDAAIAEALAAQGRAGVPLYLVYGAGGGEPAVLPQVLTQGVVIAAIDKAGRKA